jgi:hypothetical protein
MTFDNVSALEIPQEATELTTSELQQICGGHQDHKGKNKLKKHKNNKGKNKRQQHKRNNDNNNDDNNGN